MFIEKKLKLSEVLNLADALGAFNRMSEEGDGVSARLAYKMARFVAEVNKPLEVFNEQRKALFEKYGKEEEGQLIVPEAKVAEFNTEINSVLELEEEVKVLSEKINISEFGDLKLKPSFMLAFKDYIEE
jgi:hypothetical protein